MKRRVIVDNDFSGDPDDLIQLAHMLLSPSVQVCGIIGSHLARGDFLDSSDKTAENAVEAVKNLLAVMKMESGYPVLQGSNSALVSTVKPEHTPASRFIVQEAMKQDDSALYIACGGGLTDVATALINNPEITDRITLVWIGGPEYAGKSSFKIKGKEYNYNIDPLAARYIFNESKVALWQVPRDAYRQCLVTTAQLKHHVLPCGELGRVLYESIIQAMNRFSSVIKQESETYILGDQPLVLLCALQSFFDPDTSSCTYRIENRKKLTPQGSYSRRISSRPIRVFETIDTKLVFDDLFIKLANFQGPDQSP